jgi:biopolymer transport protein ExbD
VNHQIILDKNLCPLVDLFEVFLVDLIVLVVQAQFPRQTWKNISLKPSATRKGQYMRKKKIELAEK